MGQLFFADQLMAPGRPETGLTFSERATTMRTPKTSAKANNGADWYLRLSIEQKTVAVLIRSR
jgi:hypothetical protein